MTTSTSDEHAAQVLYGPTSQRAALATYVLMGILSSMIGPLLGELSKVFHISLASAGVALSVGGFGGSTGVLIAWLGLRELEGRVVMRAGLIAMSLGVFGVAIIHSWVLWNVSNFVGAMGFGTLNICLNTTLARTPVLGRAKRLSLGNAIFGVGAVIGPLLVVTFEPHNFRLLYWCLAPLLLIATLFYRDMQAPASRVAHSEQGHQYLPHRNAVLATFIVAYTLYLSLESTCTGWAASTIHGYGYSSSVGSLVTAGFWGAFALGRSFGGTFHRRFPTRNIVLACVSSALVLSPFALIHAAAPVVFVLIGLAVSMSFPMGLMWFAELNPYDSDGLSLIIMIMGLGGIVGPWVVSRLVAHGGVHVVPMAMTVEAALTIVAMLSAFRFRP